MKPFNLEEALSGKPVKIRNGPKAYVLGRIPDDIKTDYPLRGFIVKLKPTGELDDGYTACWTLSGKNYANTKLHFTDIIGMWEEEEPTKYRHINGHKFPEPCSEPLEDRQSYFTIDFEAGAEVLQYLWRDDDHDNRLLNSGLIHTTQEAAQAHADAINSLFRGEPYPD